MRIPNAAELLDVWERGQRQRLPERMLALLGIADVRPDAGMLSALFIGRRDCLLFELRERLFGPVLAFVATCPACQSALESELAVADIRMDRQTETECIVETLDYRVTFRPPTCGDLLALNERANARAALLDRCLTEIRAPGGEPARADQLPDALIAAITARMAEADPLADVELALSCPECSHGWRAEFDIAGFLWKEIHAWAKQTLRQVHGLARAYGWSESDVLALSPTRRQIYLELALQ